MRPEMPVACAAPASGLRSRAPITARRINHGMIAHTPAGELTPPRCEVLADPSAADAVRLQLSGSWRLAGALPAASEIEKELEARPGVRRVAFDTGGAPPQGSRLVGFLTRIGKETLELLHGGRELVAFLGEVTIAFGRLLRGKARFRRSDLMLTIQEVGAQALPIVSLIMTWT